MKKYAWAVALTVIIGQVAMLSPMAIQAKQQPITAIHRNPVEETLQRYIGDKHIAKAIARVQGTVRIFGIDIPKAYLIAAIAKQESDYRPQIRGDGGDSYGLFQIQQRHHGRFDDGLESQVAKCESILQPLIAQHGVAGGVRPYNGSGKKARRYAVQVLRIAKEIKDA